MKNFLNIQFTTEKDNLIAATVNILELLNVKVTREEIRETLLGDPNYPSLLSISDSLDKWHVRSDAYKITPDKLREQQAPFISHLKTSSGSFVAVKSIDGDFITYLTDNGKRVKNSLKEFSNRASGTILITEASEKSGQSDYHKKNQEEQLNLLKLPLLIFSFLIFAVISVNSAVHYFSGTTLLAYTVFFICSVAGIVITSLLLLYEYDNNNAYLKKICSVAKKTDCSAVLNSSGAKILRLSWSEIGFLYFIGSFLYLGLGSRLTATLSLPVLLSILAVPYIIYSLYYQAFVVKQWCVLCLTVQFLLLTQSIFVVITHQFNTDLWRSWHGLEYPALLTAYVFPVLIWALIKPYLFSAQQNKETKYSFLRFKNNPEVFNSLLLRQTSINNSPRGLGIMLGNPNAENALIKVCNPYCGPCAQSFPALEELFNAACDRLSIQIIFTAKPDKNDRRALPVAHFLQIAEQKNDNRAILDALGDWYTAKNKSYENYMIKHPIDVDFEKHKINLSAMNEWCIEEQITGTPTYFINGKQLPENYHLEDLKNIFRVNL